ncbi:SPOR domain-containing protein [Photobacterium lipolyticum]|uniref:SPOR domain-containing protein n=1 Tax=Photobacterium lipolyticum TaxID=266810 RepID=A0A2T3MV03_9GAMM|nr:SPOR domain-containing protein [Photobacterium lipolyticum]
MTFCHTVSSPQTGDWRQLNDQCDIGSGLWGKKPKPKEGSFWVQCNYSRSLPGKAFTEKVNTLFSNKAYLIKENDKFRCLVGPYPAHTQALKAKERFSDELNISTFIRQTTNKINILNKKQQSLPAAKPSKNKAENAQLTTLIENRVILNSIIYSFTFNGLKYHQPRNINSTKTMPPMFINEKDNYWSRVNISSAESWCKRFGLRLPYFEELERLQSYGQHLLLRYQWPTQVNYWSSSVNPLSGEIKTLNLRNGKYDEYRPPALLYTTCVSD